MVTRMKCFVLCHRVSCDLSLTQHQSALHWSPWKLGMSEGTLPTPDLHRTNCTIPGTAELQAGDGTGLWMAELWQKPTLGHVQGITRDGRQGIHKSISHNPPVLVYFLLQRSKPKNSVSIILFPMCKTSEFGLCLI